MKKLNHFLIIIVPIILICCSGPSEKKAGTDYGIIDVDGFEARFWEDNHGPCEEYPDTRVIREEGDPPTDWYLVSTWFPFNGVKLHSPHPFEVTHAEGRMERIVHYNCQKQICLADSWTDDGPPYKCNIIEEQTVRFHSGTGVTLHKWSTPMVNDAFDLGDYYKIK